jgi:LysW-gamma-L-lysine carboxypeptidase
MNTVSGRWSMPMAAYGPGDSSLDHGDDEQLSIEEYLRAITALTVCIDELGQEARGPAVPAPPASPPSPPAPQQP